MFVVKIGCSLLGCCRSFNCCSVESGELCRFPWRLCIFWVFFASHHDICRYASHGVFAGRFSRHDTVCVITIQRQQVRTICLTTAELRSSQSRAAVYSSTILSFYLCGNFSIQRKIYFKKLLMVQHLSIFIFVKCCHKVMLIFHSSTLRVN